MEASISSYQPQIGLNQDQKVIKVTFPIKNKVGPVVQFIDQKRLKNSKKLSSKYKNISDLYKAFINKKLIKITHQKLSAQLQPKYLIFDDVQGQTYNLSSDLQAEKRRSYEELFNQLRDTKKKYEALQKQLKSQTEKRQQLQALLKKKDKQLAQYKKENSTIQQQFLQINNKSELDSQDIGQNQRQNSFQNSPVVSISSNALSKQITFQEFVQQQIKKLKGRTIGQKQVYHKKYVNYQFKNLFENKVKIKVKDINLFKNLQNICVGHILSDQSLNNIFHLPYSAKISNKFFSVFQKQGITIYQKQSKEISHISDNVELSSEKQDKICIDQTKQIILDLLDLLKRLKNQQILYLNGFSIVNLIYDGKGIKLGTFQNAYACKQIYFQHVVKYVLQYYQRLNRGQTFYKNLKELEFFSYFFVNQQRRHEQQEKQFPLISQLLQKRMKLINLMLNQLSKPGQDKVSQMVAILKNQYFQNEHYIQFVLFLLKNLENLEFFKLKRDKKSTFIKESITLIKGELQQGFKAKLLKSLETIEMQSQICSQMSN